MNQDQYQKTEEGLLYIALYKALFGLTEGISLTEIKDFLEKTKDISLLETLKSFQAYIRKSNKKVAQNVGTIQRLEELLTEAKLPAMEDFVPVPLVLFLLTGKQIELTELVQHCKQESTVHSILLKLDLGLSEELEARIKKLKSNTFQAGVISNMIEGINTSKNQPFEKVLFGLGVRNIGENTAQILARHFKNIDSLKTASIQDLLEINGIGEIVAQSIQDFFIQKENNQIIARLREKGIKFEMVETERTILGHQLEGLKILASGKLNHFKRDEIVDFIEANGGQYVKAVSKNLDFIIEGEDMGPSKKEKAKKLGLKMISEAEFLEMVNENAQNRKT
jgi:DNA ligase (NAD+)